MKFKKLVLLASLGCALLATEAAQANIRVVLSPSLGADACNSLSGNWHGEGSISALLTSCHYSGSGSITKTSTPGTYNVHVDLSSDSSWPCPDSVSKDLLAVCANNVVNVNSDDVVLEDGKADENNISFTKGSVTVSGVSANVEYINLTR